MSLPLLILTPLITALLTALAPNHRAQITLHLLGAAITFGAGVAVAAEALMGSTMTAAGNLLRADILSAMLALLFGTVGAGAAIAMAYDQQPATSGTRQTYRISIGGWFLGAGGQHYTCALFHFIVLLLLLTITVTNLALLWMAALGSVIMMALLLRLSDTGTELAASYITVATASIAAALVGTIVMATARAGILDWTMLQAGANLESERLLPVQLARAAFVFALIGYGTLSGLAPLQIWLPEIAGATPAHLSVLMISVTSGAGVYALLRFKLLTDSMVEPAFSQTILLGLGLLALAVAATGVLWQRNYRRLMAYAGIGQMGVIGLGLGFGGSTGKIGAVLHLLNYILSATLLALALGRVARAYNSAEISEVRGMLRAFPLTGVLLLMGVLALAGLPPFGLFISQFLIFRAGFASDNLWVALGGATLTTLLFVGLLWRVNAMLHGEPPVGVARRESARWVLAWMALSAGLLMLLGLATPLLDGALNQIVAILTP